MTALQELTDIENQLNYFQNLLRLDFYNVEIKATTEIFGEEYDYFFGKNLGELNPFLKDIFLKNIDDLQTRLLILKINENEKNY